VNWNSSTYYDPSYGTTYAGPDAMENACVYGFGTSCVEVGGNMYIDVRTSSGAGGLNFY
jgi:hypothetical protein